MVKNEKVLKGKNFVVFGVRTFKYLKQYKYSDSLKTASMELDTRKFKIEKIYMPGMEYSNIELRYVGKPD